MEDKESEVMYGLNKVGGNFEIYEVHGACVTGEVEEEVKLTHRLKASREMAST